jgi:hypothetical protein
MGRGRAPNRSNQRGQMTPKLPAHRHPFVTLHLAHFNTLQLFFAQAFFLKLYIYYNMPGSWEEDLHWHPYDSKAERKRYRRRQRKAASICEPNNQTEPEAEALCCAIPFRSLAELVTEFKQRLCERKKAKAALAPAEPVNQTLAPDSREQTQSDHTPEEDCEFELIPIAGLHTTIDPAHSNRTSTVRPRGHCCYCGIAAFIPYEECKFCGEKPSYHHGRCCPNRPAQPTLSSADKKLGKAKHVDSLLTQEPQRG